MQGATCGLNPSQPEKPKENNISFLNFLLLKEIATKIDKINEKNVIKSNNVSTK